MKCLSLCLFCVCVSALAHAAPDTSMEAARAHFMEGTQAYSRGDYARAAVEYKAAYDAEPDPALLYNIAQAARLAHDPAQALTYYRAYLKNQPNVANHVEIEARIQELEAETRPAPPPVPASVVDATLTAPPPSPPPKPAYKKGWVWGTVVGVVVVVGAGLGLGLGLGLSHESAPSTGLGNDKVFGAVVSRGGSR